MTKKSKPKQSHSSKQSKATREKAYLGTLDLKELWEEFAFAINKNGTQKYTTVWSFVKAKAKSSWQRDFLYWLLGPKETGGDTLYSGFTQFDWEDKREKGFWYSETNLENFSDTIKKKHTAFDRLQQAGDESLLQSLAEYNELDKQVSKEFGGRLMLPNNTSEENTARVSLFFSLKKQIQDMKIHIIQSYAKTQGMDITQLTNFIEMLTMGKGSNVASQVGFGADRMLEGGTKEEKQYKGVLTQIVDTMLKKSADLEMELPSSSMEEIVNTEGRGKDRRRVQ
jgi:hypothetical protein